MHSQMRLGELFFGLMSIAIELAVLAFFIVMTCLSYRHISANWKRGLLWGSLAMLLGLPATVLALLYLDIATLARDIPSNLVGVIKIIAAIATAGLMLLMIPLRGMYYFVSQTEWNRLRIPGDSALIAGSPRWLGITAGVAVGAVAGIVSMIIFSWMDIGEGRQIKQLSQMLPGLDDVPGAILITCMLGFVIAAAIVEEFIFRGGLLGFLLRISGNRTAPACLAIIATAGLWAVLHIGNTDHPTVKVAQIFLLGLAFGAMARKWGLASSIAAHVSLNIAAVIIAMLGKGA